MTSGGPWHIKGVDRETVDNARAAARRAGMSVGQWLNSVVKEVPVENAAAGDDVYEDPYAPPAIRKAGEQGRTDNVAANANDVTAQKLADAIARLDMRIETFIAEERGAAEALGVKVESVDRALSALGRERARAGASDWSTSVEQAVDEITERQRELEREGFAPPLQPASTPPREDFTEVNDRLRRIADEVQAFGAGQMREAIDGLRNDLADVAGKLTEASPRHAIEALEREVQRLAAQIEASSGTSRGVDISSIEDGLRDVREAIHGLMPAESLTSIVDAVHVLAQKIDQIASGGQDPAALQQLEAAIAGLRTIVSRVASDDSLAALTAEVRALSERIGSGVTASSDKILQTLEQRIATIADAIEAVRISAVSPGSTALEAAIHALGEKIDRIQSVPSQHGAGTDLGAMIDSLGDRIERMQASAPDPFSGNSPFSTMVQSLGEKIERLQAGSGDAELLRQIEQRVAALGSKLEASEAKLGNLDSIDRGMKELLAYLENERMAPAKKEPAPPQVVAIEEDVRRTQDSLEAAHGTIGDVVDRLAMIETGMRNGKAPTAPVTIPAQPPAGARQARPAAPDVPDLPSVSAPSVAPAAATIRPPLGPQSKPADTKAAAVAGDFLPHDFPLEPGSGKPAVAPAGTTSASPGVMPTPAERIAASRAVAQPSRGAASDMDAKSNFIVAARRAAQAAAEDDSVFTSSALTADLEAPPASGSRLGRVVKPILIGASIVVIIVGALHLAAGFLSPREASGPQSRISTPAPAEHAGSAGVLIQSPAADARTNAGVLPGTGNGDGGLPLAPSHPAAAPEGSTDSPAAPSQRSDVTGALVTDAVAPISLETLFPTPQAARAAALPTAIGGRTLISAAEAGDPAAAYEVALRFADGRGVPLNPEAAAFWFERAARGGLVPAIFRLGGIYEKGIGIRKDLARARDLYIAAAARGNAKAMHNLAVIYADGADGKPDYAAAVQWFHKAAARGVPDSQYNLGVIYARGIGVEQNLGESFRWFALAAQGGDQDAAQKRDDVAKRLDAQTLAAMQAAIQSWTPELQPDEAVTVKPPPGGWDAASSPTASKTKAKRASGGRVATTY
jgi:localization factor PodJL